MYQDPYFVIVVGSMTSVRNANNLDLHRVVTVKRIRIFRPWIRILVGTIALEKWNSGTCKGNDNKDAALLWIWIRLIFVTLFRILQNKD